MSGEEAYVLRFEDPALAARVRAVLRGEADANPADAAMELDFDETRLVDGEARHGTFTVGRERHACVLLDAPTAIEAYVSLDDANLVKTGDVGQIVLVRRPGAPPLPHPPTGAAAASGAGPAHAYESVDGVTPPMTDARARHFARRPTAPRADVAAAEDALLRIAQGGAPDGVEFEDVEEEYKPGEGGLGGAWVEVEPSGTRKRRGRPPGSGRGRGARGGSSAPGGSVGGRSGSGAPSASPSASAGGSEATGGGEGEVEMI